MLAAPAGAALGVLSRVEETQPWALGISTDATWVALAFAVGALASRGGARAAAMAGALALTAANAAYYAWIELHQPGSGLSAVTWPHARWFALGIAGGACFALAGRLFATRRGGPRLLACAPLAAVCVANAITLRSDGAVAGVLEQLLP